MCVQTKRQALVKKHLVWSEVSLIHLKTLKNLLIGLAFQGIKLQTVFAG